MLMQQRTSRSEEKSDVQEQTDVVKMRVVACSSTSEINDTTTEQADSERRKRLTEEHKRVFTEQINALLATKKGQHHGFMSKEKYKGIIETLEMWENMTVQERISIRSGYRYACTFFHDNLWGKTRIIVEKAQ